MNKVITFTGIGAAIAAAAIGGGVGVAVAHGGHDAMGDHAGMMGGSMPMDPAGMQEHMKQVMGESAYQVMQEAMKQALGEDGYQQMLDRMATGCTGDAASMMQGATGTPSLPGHDAHHPTTTTGTN